MFVRPQCRSPPNSDPRGMHPRPERDRGPRPRTPLMASELSQCHFLLVLLSPSSSQSEFIHTKFPSVTVSLSDLIVCLTDLSVRFTVGNTLVPIFGDTSYYLSVFFF